jgi:hypothetical protein
VAIRVVSTEVFFRMLKSDDWTELQHTSDDYVRIWKVGHAKPIAFFLQTELTIRAIRNFCNNARINDARFDELHAQAAKPKPEL